MGFPGSLCCILKWAFLALCVVLVIVLCIYAYAAAQKWYEERPKLAESLQGVNIGEKFSDFMFRNPGFSEVQRIQGIQNNTKDYYNKEKRLFVDFRDGVVSDVTYICDNVDFVSINGISCGTSGEQIQSHFAKETRILCMKDKSDKDYLTRRVFDTFKFGVRYFLNSNKVEGIRIASPRDLEGYIGVNWVPCE
jgi:hypothetical protein